MKRLSKSRYTTYCQCPKALWLKVYKPDEATVDASVEARFESGNRLRLLTTSIVSSSLLLIYHNLDERCQNGGHAMTIFPRIQFMEPEEAAASREALLRYCELDTWAMVKVWEKLKEVAE